MEVPHSFYALPDPPGTVDHTWPTRLLAAYEQIKNIYLHAAQILRQDEADALQAAFHIDTIRSNAIPMLSAIEAEVNSGSLHLPLQWLYECSKLMGNLVVALRDQARMGDVRYPALDERNVNIPQLVTKTATGQKGRPQKEINLDFLCEAFSKHRDIKLADLSSLLGVHRNTLRAHMRRNGVYKEYSTLSNDDIDTLLRKFKTKKPNAGLQYVVGFLRKNGLRLQRHKVRSSLRRIDGIGRALRRHQRIKRRKYTVKRPNALWHLDGHHKLIRWGIVLHGFIDGYSRTVVALRAHSNNRAVTVLDLFLDAITEYGMPSRLRGDRGGENIACAIYMVLKRGPNRASFMWGSSTRNTRIERLWVEVGTHFARQWRAFFTRLERIHLLRIDNPVHLWLLHILFLDAINTDCADFKDTWNSHPIKGAGGSPNDIRLIGQTRFGIYNDDCSGIHPKTINEYYGTDRQEDKNEAPHADPNIEDIATRIRAGQDAQTRHEGVEVSPGYCPFLSPSAEQKFYEVLENVIEARVVPAGYGLLPDEWELGEYPLTEVLQIGVRSRKDMDIELRDKLWYNRAVLWGQALSTLSCFFDSNML